MGSLQARIGAFALLVLLLAGCGSHGHAKHASTQTIGHVRAWLPTSRVAPPGALPNPKPGLAFDRRWVGHRNSQHNVFRYVSTRRPVQGSGLKLRTRNHILALANPPYVGESLTSNTGTWSGCASGCTYTYQWAHCNSAGSTCTNVGVTNTYIIQTGDVGFTIRVGVTATNSFGSATAYSDLTAVVVASQSTTSSASYYWGTSSIGTQFTGSGAPNSTDWTAENDFSNTDAGGKSISTIATGQSWADCGGIGAACAFPTSTFNNIRNNGAIPQMTWQSQSGYDYNNGIAQPAAFTDQAIAGTNGGPGSEDSYIDTWAAAAKAWGHPFFLRLDHEMNGTWYPWSPGKNGNTAASYVAMWRHVHDRMVNTDGVTNITWVWSPNIDPGNTLAATTGPLSGLYPGSAYVDWTGLDGYNGNPWRSFSTLYGSTYNTIAGSGGFATDKPMMDAEVSSTETGGSKAQWITDMFSVLPTQFPKMHALYWYDNATVGPGGFTDWPLESSTTAEQSFTAGIADTAYRAGVYNSISTTPIPIPSVPRGLVRRAPALPYTLTPSGGWSVAYSDAFNANTFACGCNTTSSSGVDATWNINSGNLTGNKLPLNYCTSGCNNELQYFSAAQVTQQSDGLHLQCKYSPNLGTAATGTPELNYLCGIVDTGQNEGSSSANGTGFKFRTDEAGEYWAIEIVTKEAQVPDGGLANGGNDEGWWASAHPWQNEIDFFEHWGWGENAQNTQGCAGTGCVFLTSPFNGTASPTCATTSKCSMNANVWIYNTCLGSCNQHVTADTVASYDCGCDPSAAFHTYTFYITPSASYSVYMDGHFIDQYNGVPLTAANNQLWDALVLSYALRDNNVSDPIPGFTSGARDWVIQSETVYQDTAHKGLDIQNGGLAPGTSTG